MISAVLFLVGDGINHPLSQQVKMDVIAKNMIPNANFAERNLKVQCDIHKGKNGLCVYFDLEMLPRVAHTFTKNVACIIYEKLFFVMVKNQTKDDACVYLYG